MNYKDLIMNNSKINSTDFDELKISFISNINLNPYLQPYLVKYFADLNIMPNVVDIPYELLMDSIHSIEESDIIVIWLNFELLFPDAFHKLLTGVKKEEELIDEIVNYSLNTLSFVKKTKGRIIWINYEDNSNKEYLISGYNYLNTSYIDFINNTIKNTVADNTVFIDLRQIISLIGINNAYDNRNFYRFNSPYTPALIELIVKELLKQYKVIYKKTKKCIVLDCDNVLWGGIVSEIGMQNLKLGGIGTKCPFEDFQKFILSLYHHGVIICICSKNDLSDVLHVFRSHSGMILKEDHIAVFEVNWNNKVDNIKRIAKQLNIGLDSMVFVDDSTFEIESVKSILPEVEAVLYDRNVYDNLNSFHISTDIDVNSIQTRNQTYKTNSKRFELKEKSNSFEEYLLALDIKVEIHEATIDEYNRISELSLRTNKFTNGARYSIDDLYKKLSNVNYKLYSVYVTDKFGGLGLVGSIGILGNKIEIINLSCRALGRNIEKDMFEFINNNHKVDDIAFVSTGKNEQVKIMLDSYLK